MKLFTSIIASAVLALASAGQVFTGSNFQHQQPRGFVQQDQQYQQIPQYIQQARPQHQIQQQLHIPGHQAQLQAMPQHQIQQQQHIHVPQTQLQARPQHQIQQQQHIQGHQTQLQAELQYEVRPEYHQQARPEQAARILSYHAENNGHNYQYSYETDNGIKAQEAGQTIDKGTAAQGEYSYTGDDGQTYTVTYTADEFGFRPQGDHLPTPPPIPEAIAKALEQNAQDAANGIFDDGSYKQQSDQDSQQYKNYQQASNQQQNYQLGNNYQQSYQQSYQQPRTYQQSNYQYQPAQVAVSGNSGYHQ